MFNFRNLPLFDKDNSKDTDEIKTFLNSYEGIYFSSSNKFINVFLDKILIIDPSSLNVITINTDLYVVDFVFNEKNKNLIVLGKGKNSLICSVYNIRECNFTLLKKIQLSKNINNIKKTLIAKCNEYIITLENKKITFYFLNKDYSINQSELIDDGKEHIENIYLSKNHILLVIKNSYIYIYQLDIQNSHISYTHIDSFNLSLSYIRDCTNNKKKHINKINEISNSDKKKVNNENNISSNNINHNNYNDIPNNNNNNNNINMVNDSVNYNTLQNNDEPLLSIYNEDLNILYICQNMYNVLFVLNLNNLSFEFILLENKIINLFSCKFYLILLKEINKKYFLHIYIIYEDMKLLVSTLLLNEPISNVIFFNNLFFLLIEEQISKPEIKVDKFYFYEQLKLKLHSKLDGDALKILKRDNVTNINVCKQEEKYKLKNEQKNIETYNNNNNNNHNHNNNVVDSSNNHIYNNNELNNNKYISNDFFFNEDINTDMKKELYNLNLTNDSINHDTTKKTQKQTNQNDTTMSLSKDEKNNDTNKFFNENIFTLNKFFKNCRNQIKIILKERNINEIINMFKKKKLFQWLIKYANLNKNYQTININFIHKIYADFLFEKEQYENAIYEYIETINYLETSYVIHKYLNLDLYEYLTIYLEKLHVYHHFNDEHTMMLLSCYKKQCKKKKMISFIKKNKDKINLNKTYKFLLNAGYYNIVLNLSKKYKDHFTYVSILIEKYENYEKSLKYIFKLDVENICILLFKYGYKFIKYYPQLTIYLLKKIIKKYNINLTIFIPLFLDNIDFLFMFIVKFLDKNVNINKINHIQEKQKDKYSINYHSNDESNSMSKEKNDINSFGIYEKDNNHSNSQSHNDNYDNNSSDLNNSQVSTTPVNLINRTNLQLDIFNGEYDYILFVTVIQILLQKYKKSLQEENQPKKQTNKQNAKSTTKNKKINQDETNEQNNILTFNIDKLIQNSKDKNINFLSVLLLSIYNYNKGLIYTSTQMNKYDISLLFSIHKLINNTKVKIKKIYNPEYKVYEQLSTYKPKEQTNQINNSYKILNRKFQKVLYNICINHLKLNGSLSYNYIFYYLSMLNDEKYLIKFIKKIRQNMNLSIFNLIQILKKYNKSYSCIQNMVVAYMNDMNKNINDKCIEIEKDKKELKKIKKKQLKKKYNFHLIDNAYCSICKEILSVPMVHFLCKHSYHTYCLKDNNVCILCHNKDKEKKLLKEKAINSVQNFDEFFKYLQGSTDKFSYISNYLSYGITPK
ncbi:vacuolar protein sorting-associated protein 11, putative [Plasmodium sp. gorilla clade G2]|uniref:vacuolar protein sorting-associated protein 11, putative n=1 Tax=Plasmodium sp. gorilla clade G2 TaxID=880535 RepID=UPI000D20BD56|nr:vacuolar protein sorting-associated protein 11, putative [Plasmodium sp. gorilla clade G2]SOV11540.1 vacuolar protein sorting-associated protein 11, putative [Plasmodium sp. gorilla clade G2]